MDRVKDKVALVTGAENLDGETVGLGRATALMLAREGSKVVVTDIAERAGDSVVEDIRGAGGEAVYAHLDASSEADWQAAMTATRDAFGRLDIVVNMAGVAFDGSI